MNDQLDGIELSILYRNVRIINQWESLIYYKVERKSLLASSKEGRTFTAEGWKKMVNYYFNEIFNVSERREEVHRILIRKVSDHSGLSEREIGLIFEEARLEAENMGSYGTPGVRVEDNRSLVIFNVGTLSFRLRNSAYRRLRAVARSVEEVGCLLLRYYPLGSVSGFFWSIDPRAYRKLLREDIPTIEGFASPFNRNLEIYCSLYEDDRPYGSIGNFFDVVAREWRPVRFILNPPYTEFLMEKTAAAALEYVKRVEGGECVLMLPNYGECKAIECLRSYGGTQTEVFNEGEYSIYDHHNERSMMTPMSLAFFVVRQPGLPGLSGRDLRSIISETIDAETDASPGPSRGRVSPSDWRRKRTVDSERVAKQQCDIERCNRSFKEACTGL